MLLLIILIVFIISMFGDPLMKLIAFGVLLYVVSKDHFYCHENFACKQETQYHCGKQPIKCPTPSPAEIKYIVGADFRDEPEDLDTMMAKKNIQTGEQAKIITKGQMRSHVNDLKPYLEEEFKYYDNVDWWND